MIRNAILLAGGSGKRLLPFTKIYSKQLLYLAGQAVIDFPIKTLTDLGVENITIILGSTFAGQIIDYCGDGEKYGVNFNYIYQYKPEGISQAINLAKKFVADDEKFLVILGDNFFSDPVNLPEKKVDGATIFLTEHPDLKRFGVASIFDGKIIKIEEKPLEIFPSISSANYAITGLYQFDQKFFEYFSNSYKSLRGEFEITDIIRAYYNDGKLDYQVIGGEWSDAGTIEGLNYLNHKLCKEQE